MRAADTNVLVRLLVQDEVRQTAQAEAFLHEGGALWISHLVLAETVWVLDAVYGQKKKDILKLLEVLLDNRDLRLAEPKVVKAALDLYRESKAGFTDCLVLETARTHGHLPLATFDRELGKLPGAEALAVR